MNGVWALIAAVIAFGITAIMGKWMIPFLHKINFGQTIRDEGPKWHKKKQGTPTMGGIMFIIGILIATVVAVPCYWQISSDNVFQNVRNRPDGDKDLRGLCLALGYGLIGYLDDYIKVVRKRKFGLDSQAKADSPVSGGGRLFSGDLPFRRYRHHGDPLCGPGGPGMGLLAHRGGFDRRRGERGEFHDGIDGLNGSDHPSFCRVLYGDFQLSLHVWSEHYGRRRGRRMPGLSSVELQPR